MWVHSGGTLYSGDDWYDRNMRQELMVVECVLFLVGGGVGGTLSGADKVAPSFMAFFSPNVMSSLGYCLACKNLLEIHQRMLGGGRGGGRGGRGGHCNCCVGILSVLCTAYICPCLCW